MYTTINTVKTGPRHVALTEVYDRLKYDALGSPPSHPLDNEFLAAIDAATEFAESMTRRCIQVTDCTLVLSRFPNKYRDEHDWVELLCPPIRSLRDVRYYDDNNELQTLASTEYVLASESNPPRLHPVGTSFWPTTYDRADAVLIRYESGYDLVGASPTIGPELPAGIRQAILVGVQLLLDELAVDKRNALDALRANLLGGHRVNTF